MQNSARTNVILLIVGILVLGAAAYMLFGMDGEASAITASGAPGSEAEMTFLNLVAQIDPVEFDTSILEDPRFRALQDIRTAIIPELSGRADPFAPLGAAK